MHVFALIAIEEKLRLENRDSDVEGVSVVELFVGYGLSVVYGESRLLIEVGCVPRAPHSFDELSARCVSVAVNDAIDIVVEELLKQGVYQTLRKIEFSAPTLSAILTLKNGVYLTWSR